MAPNTAVTPQDPDRIRIASTSIADAELAVRDLFHNFDLPELTGVILFCSSRYDLEALERALAQRSDGLTIIGCTSSGELAPGTGHDEGTISAIGFPASRFRLSGLCLDHLDAFDPALAQQQVRMHAADAQKSSSELGDHLWRAAIFLVDGLSTREEILTLTIQDALGDIPLIGGSSGDGLRFRETFVLWDGKFRRDAAIVAILSSSRPLEIFQTKHYLPGTTKMVITRANPLTRRVEEINAEPAVDEYARLTGVRAEDLEPGHFAAHPPMVRAGGEYYVRSIQSANSDGSLTFYCAIDEGLVLTLGEPGPIPQNLRRIFGDLDRTVGGLECVLAFDCVLNAVEIERRQLRREVAEIYAKAGVVGFSTYGEQFHALHTNQTLSGIAFGR